MIGIDCVRIKLEYIACFLPDSAHGRSRMSIRDLGRLSLAPLLSALPRSPETMTTGSAAFTIDRSVTFPTFCAVAFRSADDAVVPCVDFWAVSPCGDPTADYARGRRYADEAIGHVRTTGQPVFIQCVLMSMGMKLRYRDAGELEIGFVDRITNDFPHAMDDFMLRLSRCRLKHLS